MPSLRYLDADGKERTLDLHDEPVTIGRSPACAVIFDHELVSREHARIQRQDAGRFLIRDLGSRNKTFVNGQAVAEVVLMSGDVVRIGEFVIEFLDDRIRAAGGELDFLTPDRVEPAHSEWVKAKAPVALMCAQIEQIARLGAATRIAARPEDVADAALAQLLLDVAAERGFVALRGEGKRELKLVCQRGLRRAPGGSMIPVSQAFVYAIVLQQVAGRYPASNSNLTTDAGYASTAMAAPLTHNGDIVGVVYVDRPSDRKRAFPVTALAYLEAAGAHIGSLMAYATQRLAGSAAREESAHVAVLRQLQAHLSCDPPTNELHETAIARQQGRCRCGDLFDLFFVEDHRGYLLMLDGGGAGVSGFTQAAAIRAGVRAAISTQDAHLLDPAPVFDAVNRMIAGASVCQPVACTYLGWDAAAGRLAYINAGGPPPLVLAAPGRLITLEQSGLLLGVDPAYAFEATTVDLPERFRLIGVSDGVIDAAMTGEPFSAQRLHELLVAHESYGSAADIAGIILAALKKHLGDGPCDDDATVLVVARR